MQPEEIHTEFPPTQWTLIEALSADTHPRHSEALETLSTRYWAPIYAYLRRMGKPPQDAAELTQAFFADVVLQRGLFGNADRRRGRLRALVRSALTRYVRDQHRRRLARRADVTFSLEQLTQEEAFISDDSSSSPDQAFERRWATNALQEALRRCEQQLRATGRGRHWAVFESQVVWPSIGATPRLPLTQAAREAGFDSPSEAAGALRTVRKRTVMLLREVVAGTTSDRDDKEEEFLRVESVLRSGVVD